MKAQTVILLATVALLVVSSAAWAQPGGPPGYVVKPGTASGGRYRLTSAAWQVRGAAGGGGYRLVALVSAAGTGTPCCCNYLPCVLRND